MKVLSFIKKTFYNTAALFLLCQAFVLCVFFITNTGNAATMAAPVFSLCTLLFSFISALVFSVFGCIPKIPAVIKYVLEFILVYAAFYVSIFGISGNAGRYSSVFMMSTLFVIVYAVIGFAVLIARRLTAQKENEKTAYEKQYGEIK